MYEFKQKTDILKYILKPTNTESQRTEENLEERHFHFFIKYNAFHLRFYIYAHNFTKKTQEIENLFCVFLYIRILRRICFYLRIFNNSIINLN